MRTMEQVEALELEHKLVKAEIKFDAERLNCRVGRLQGGTVMVITRKRLSVSDIWFWPDDFHTLSDTGTVREDPRTPRMNTVFTGTKKVICRVQCNEPDDVRCVFLDPDSEIPDYVLDPSQPYYNDIDAGKLIETSGKTAYTSDMAPGCSRYSSSGLDSADKEKVWSITREGMTEIADTSRYSAMHEKYINAFMRGKSATIKLKCFDVKRYEMAYSDTVINTDKDGLLKALTFIRKEYETDFTSLYGPMLKACSGVKFTVNGTSIMVEKKESEAGAELWYVNGFKITRSDLDEVLDHSLCFPKDTAAFNAYLREVSRISLKFHRAMSEGLVIRLPDNAVTGVKRPSGANAIRVPGGHGSGGSSLEIVRKINKVVGSKASFDLGGETRLMLDFDTVRRVLKGSLTHSSGDRMPVNNVALGNLRSLAKFLMTLDLYLAPESRFIPETLFTMESKNKQVYDYAVSAYQDTVVQYRVLPDSPEVITHLTDLVAVFAEEFKLAIDTEQEVLRKSYSLLQQVMKETGARDVVKDGKHAYHVTGVSGTGYIVNEADARVTDAAGNHICIVKASNDVRGYDYIASLLVALHQDRYTAKEIHTLAGAMARNAKPGA